MPYTPTISGRQLARELRQLREKTEMTGEHAATKIGWEQSKISRMETGKMRITSGEVMELCEAYGVDGEQRDRLVALARHARQRDWWHAYGDIVKKGFVDYLGFEAEAQSYRGYEPQLIPGILQIEPYARAVFRGGKPRTPEEITRNVEVRLARQKRLRTSENPLQVWTVIDEAALDRMIDGRDVMGRQLEHLLEAAELGNVSIQVLPYQAGVHAAIDGSFVILTFDGYPDLLYIEHLMGCVYLERSSETTRGSAIFDHLRSTALNTGDSTVLIRKKLEKCR